MLSSFYVELWGELGHSNVGCKYENWVHRQITSYEIHLFSE